MVSLSFQKLTTFMLKYRTHTFKFTSFGLMIAPKTYQRAMDITLKDLPFVCGYLDHVIVFFSNMEFHIKHVKPVLDHISIYNIKWNISNFAFFRQENELLVTSSVQTM